MIGIFDSGVGGLTVVKEISKLLPKHQILYFGDAARLPYGTKGEKFVKKFSEKITRWLKTNGADVIVIACNTSSAWAADSLKKNFPALPIFEMIMPAVEEAEAQTKNKKIGIIATPGTVKSGVYEKKLARSKNKFKLYSKACPLFVPLAEEGLVSDEITELAVKKYLQPLKLAGIDTLILGCTHYPLLEKTIGKEMGKKVKIVNPAKALASQLEDFLQKNPKIDAKIKKSGKIEFYFSDTPYNLGKISHICFKRKINPVIFDPFSNGK